MTTDLESRLEEILRADAGIMNLLAALRGCRLPQWRLAAGAIYQTVWNHLSGLPAGTGVRDYDVLYFDASDLSWEAEDAVIRQVAAATAGCLGPVETRNQARVHLWFEGKFGTPYPPLGSTDESLPRYAAPVHAVAVRLEEDGRLDIAAPFGLEDIFSMTIRPMPGRPVSPGLAEKSAGMALIWPQLTLKL